MAPLANAVIVGFSSAPFFPLPGETITITMYSDELIISACIALLTDNGFGGTAHPGSWNTLFTTYDNGYNGTDYGYGTGDLVFATGAVNTPNYATGNLYSFTYDIPSDLTELTLTFTVDDMPVWFYESYVSYWDGTETVTVSMKDMTFTVMEPIPEPMTIALLGLGGLFLHRRK